MTQIGEKIIPFASWDEGTATVFAADASVVPELEAVRMDSIHKPAWIRLARGLRVVAENVPVGWGELVFDRLDADIAHAMMSINAVKGWKSAPVFGCVTQKGSERRRAHFAAVLPATTLAVSWRDFTGQDIEVSIAIKPTSSIASRAARSQRPARPEAIEMETHGRHDPAWASAPRRLPKPCWR